MKKSELKNIIKEALTPEEASKVAPKYKEFYSGMAKSNPLKLKKYDNPDAMVMGRVINHLTKNRKMEENRITELVKVALMGPINETLDDKVNDLVYKLTFAVGGADSLLTELIRAMSTDDAMLYLSAIAKDYDMFDDAEEISEKKTDHNKDGKIDSDDYMIARDKAIKKSKAKANESLAERILKELRG